ncbi:hypothetical protein [Streptomyces sp. 6-11-2]|uniref:hypothetical protein n=1 Tax=Streptomyces sp. 6-11-2 TaxID=2585753 RepID=UPI00116946E2|nr:hypothetical protein [Streptomyces sp. 6-11-2]GED89333.1 hypothetical protein TNCT6_64180 [Streptomyces sp. 6-11-2]
MGRLERRAAKANPYASNPSTSDRDKQARRQEKADRQAASRRTGHQTELRTNWRPRWPW